ncbi:MAG: trypsin-like peptidase domain-containing protein [Xanthobacteraceae bacterium]|nr:trypsin-like peptidase domain-containing protein [Xanthobacteraceae bacterium]
MSFATLVARVEPDVIAVRVSKVEAPAPSGGVAHNDFTRLDEQTSGAGNIIEAGGSGFFVSPDGYALTNNHVVEGAMSIQVKTTDGHIYSAHVAGKDPKTDLALIKVDTNRRFSYATFADHPPSVGDWVLTIGSQFGFDNTVTAGIVSGHGRNIGVGPYDDYLQIDAPINRGSSGGPAFNMKGQVVGINSAIYSPCGGSVGVAFDVPAATAKFVVSGLKEQGRVLRGWVGVHLQTMTPELASGFGLSKAEGVVVDAPVPDSPAAQAGIRAGDIIADVDGAPIKDRPDFGRRIGMISPGHQAKLRILRDGNSKLVALTVAAKPDAIEAVVNTSPVETAALEPRIVLALAPADHGALITSVTPEKLAAARGVKAGDVVLSVGRTAVANPGQVRQQLQALRRAGKQTVLMRVRAGSAIRFIALPLEQVALTPQDERQIQAWTPADPPNGGPN